jgi:anti-sigma factor RsiW
VKKRHHPEHLSAERIQALLDGELSSYERAGAEEHLRSCARCVGEMEEWRALFQGIGKLPVLVPGKGFSDLVMSGLTVHEPIPLTARVRQSLEAMLSEAASHHVGDPLLQDVLDGLAPADLAARVAAHLETCSPCAAEAGTWRSLLGQLDEVPRFAPAPGFAERVMREVSVPEPAAVGRRVPEWRRALAAVSRLVPKTRQAWAALSGVAVTPAVTAGLVLWTLFTHPTLTPGALASFAWWKITDLASAAWQAVASSALESSGVFEVFSLLASLPLSPMTLAGAFLTLSLGTVVAAWVLYRNLLATGPSDGRLTHAP